MRYSIIYTAAAMATSALAAAPEQVPGMKVLWSDDFSGNGEIDTSKWGYYKGARTNNEMQDYSQSAQYCQVSGGSLHITPTKTAAGWASCRIESVPAWEPPQGGKVRFQSKFKVNNAGADNMAGIWPAFWALGDSMRHGTPWPTCGEIDTFESVKGENLGHGTLHCGPACNDQAPSYMGLGSTQAFDVSAFHTWAHEIDRTAGDDNFQQQSITFFLDGNPFHEVKGSDVVDKEAWANLAQKAYYITLNVAVGGNWPGPPNDQTTSGEAVSMEVQYVAVYASG
jgi:hypothetical protein